MTLNKKLHRIKVVLFLVIKMIRETLKDKKTLELRVRLVKEDRKIMLIKVEEHVFKIKIINVGIIIIIIVLLEISALDMMVILNMAFVLGQEVNLVIELPRFSIIM